ncbi:hypothetical protein HYT26_04285 [Candidatus Pacearchaeota archaeon]|nr:hypothetical protein [Candidatus Pacearchaeota archaeon]
MENKNVGILIIGISIVIAILVWIFNISLRSIAGLSCTMGPTCPMYNTASVQMWVSLSIVAVVFIIGIVIMFTKPQEKIVIRKVREKEQKIRVNMNELDKDEKKIVKAIQDADGTIFQSDIADKTGFSKVKVTRILDRLEGRQLLERKRRGMTNVVVLKG